MIFAKIGLLLKCVKVLNRIEHAWEEGAMPQQVSKTKIGTVVTAIAGLCALYLAVEARSMSVIDAVVAAVAIIGGVITFFGGRDAADKVIAAIRGK